MPHAGVVVLRPTRLPVDAVAKRLVGALATHPYQTLQNSVLALRD
jgi:hypothetical protein